jgi:hypothetical protein
LIFGKIKYIYIVYKMNGGLGGMRLRSKTVQKPMGIVNHSRIWGQAMATRNSGLLAYSGTLNNNV